MVAPSLNPAARVPPVPWSGIQSGGKSAADPYLVEALARENGSATLLPPALL